MSMDIVRVCDLAGYVAQDCPTRLTGPRSSKFLNKIIEPGTSFS